MLPSREYGLKNESDIIDYLNEKKVNELNEKWKKHIITMFPFCTENDIVRAHHYEDQNGKPDMVVSVRHTNQYVSIKTGKKCSMHQEPFETFAAFLKKKGVSERTLKILRFYQYGESDKANNNGKPFSPKQLEEKFKDYFTEASKDLDKIDLIDCVIFRTILKGCVLKRYKVNYLYYGNLETGYLLSEEDIYSLVLQYRNHDKTAIHFGGLNFQPCQRQRNKITFHDCRIKWPILSLLYYRSEDDIRDIVSGKMRV